MSIIPPDPGTTTDSITPPFPIRVMEQLQKVSTELGQIGRPELVDVKADIDRAIARLRSMGGNE